ncbi:MarR family transcriptional regulator [Nocardia transvalensis]|uniref:MarR family transcriptional regulator n=1 Tax=Nocardia transvalensis TaxID=37333 RepID=UPI0018962608|nr:MarR family transcriptional regulator [Nocardia transvalensis]MBF6328335.1 MarR family transcriptional regulator [Nocardia transvalensis]
MTSGKARNETLNSLQLALREQATRTVLFHSAVASRLGLTVTDLSCLNLLSMDGPQTPGQLARRIGITRGGAVTAMVDRLEKAGYVRRDRDPADRRRVLIALTDTVVQRVTPLFADLGRAIAEQLADYHDHDLTALLGFVTDTTDALTRTTRDLRERPSF